MMHTFIPVMTHNSELTPKEENEKVHFCLSFSNLRIPHEDILTQNLNFLVLFLLLVGCCLPLFCKCWGCQTVVGNC